MQFRGTVLVGDEHERIEFEIGDPRSSSNLSNDELIRFGGPKGNDPITGVRDYSAGADMSLPGNRIQVQAGHHRVCEVGVRVRAGTLDPNTLIEFQLGRP